MIDRSVPPPIQALDNIPFPTVHTHYLDNGIPVYEVDSGTQDAIKLELIFDGGRIQEKKKLVGKATNSQLKEGGINLTAAEIAEALDFYGCIINLPFNLDTSNVALFCLRKHFRKVLPSLEEIIKRPIFPENEIKSYISRNIKKLEVELAKNDVVAYRTITEKIFGSDHPYGYNSNPALYGALTREDLIQHHERTYTAQNTRIIISGRTEGLITDLNDFLGNLQPGEQLEHPLLASATLAPSSLKISNTKNVQTAIRIGKRLFNRHHPDFIGCYVLVNILGGYFGSRLMTNIREEKGYTYNIYATIDAMAHDGCLYIATEVGNEFAENTLTEIRKEINLLQTELVTKEELATVKSYLLGNLLTMVDGPFNTSEIVKSMVIDDLPFSFFENLIRGIKEVSAEEIRELAQKHLDWATMWKVIVE